MDLRLTAEQEQYRRDVCALLGRDDVQAEAAAARRLPPGQEPGLLDVYRLLGERGWLAPNWPADHGGLGRTIVEKAILTEEMIAHGVPDVVHTLAIDIVGLAVHLFGSTEMQDRLLPRLARGEGLGCVLFSEPEVGSDLASLTTRAEREPGGWRLYGRKIYSLKSHLADFGLCAARTTASEVPYHGITVFAVPLDTPGVTVRPMWTMADERFGEVTLSGLLMTEADVLGEVDGGWPVVGRVLGLERTGIEFAAKGRRLLDAVLSHQDAVLEPEEGPSPYAEQLVALDAQVRAGQLLSWQALGKLAAGDYDDPVYPMAKWHSTETAKAIAAITAEVCGLDAVLAARDPDSPAGWVVESALRDAPGFTLASGTSEVMLSLIASGALGLAP